jgi:PAS domain S-box-containing protein
MYTQFSYLNEPYTWLLFCTTTVTWMMAAIVWHHKDKPGGMALSLMLVAMGLWSLGSALEFMAISLEAKDFWVKLAWVGVAFVAPFLLLAAFHHTGQEKTLKSPLLPLLWLMPVVTVVMVFTNSWHHLMWRSIGWASPGSNAVIYDFGGWFWMHILFVNGVIITATLLFTRALGKLRGIFRRQAFVALPALSFPWMVNILYLFELGPEVDLTPIAFGLTGLLIALAFMRFRLLDLTPIARDRMIESMPDGMLTLDANNQIVDYNLAAQQLLGQKTSFQIGQKIEALFVNWPEIVAPFHANEPKQYELAVLEDDIPRYLNVQITPLRDNKNLIGHLIILRDITNRKQTEARLQRKTDETVKMAQEIAHLFKEEQTQRKMADSLRQMVMTLNSSLDYQIVVRKILTLARNVVNYDSAGLFLHEENNLVLTDGVELDPSIFGYRIPLNSQNRTILVFNRRQPDVIADVRTDPYWETLSPFGHRIRSWMAVPLVIGNQAIGVVTIDSYTVGAYGEEESQVLQIFANQAAVAVQNARLHQQAQTAATLEERNRLAQDLHDAVNQTLFSASLIAEAVPDIWKKDPEQGRQGLEELRLLTQSALAEMRTLLLELRPTGLITKTLGELLTHLTTTVSSRSRTPVELAIESDARLPDKVQISFYRMAQEAFNNIEKHAGATQIHVRLTAAPHAATLVIIDNGRGFNPKQSWPGHLGVKIMQERAQSIGAVLTMNSAPHNGVQIKITWQNGSEENR